MKPGQAVRDAKRNLIVHRIISSILREEKAGSTGGYRKGLNVCQSVADCKERYACKREHLRSVRLCRLKRWMRTS